jgi:hypothetical protein
LKNKAKLKKAPRSKGTKTIEPREGQESTNKYLKRCQTTKLGKMLKRKRTHKPEEVLTNKST